ncbi:hypothetical protein TUSST3_30690 [Streptomyces sp. TUS-ST3]|nr:hypothetical protein TUSST3_30690 [Streptomyces sp. TUS-ST3]
MLADLAQHLEPGCRRYPAGRDKDADGLVDRRVGVDRMLQVGASLLETGHSGVRRSVRRSPLLAEGRHAGFSREGVGVPVRLPRTGTARHPQRETKITRGVGEVLSPTMVGERTREAVSPTPPLPSRHRVLAHTRIPSLRAGSAADQVSHGQDCHVRRATP